MIKEALEYLTTFGRESSEPKDLKIDDPHAYHYAIKGELVTVPTPYPRDSHVESLADLSAYATKFMEDISEPCAAYYDAAHVVFVQDDDAARANTVTFSLDQSDQFKTMLSLRTRNWLDQKAFIRLLKVELAGTLDPRMLLDTIRKVKFENGTVVTGEVRRAKESLGREILSSVDAGSEIPEEVTLAIRVYKSYGERDTYSCRCAVEIDPASLQAFRLTPLPDEIERIQHLAMESISSRLSESLPDSIPVYFGRP